MLTDEQERESIRTLRRCGVTGRISIARPEAEDEIVFIVSQEGAARMNQDEATRSLMDLLSMKVWITTDGELWQERKLASEDPGG